MPATQTVNQDHPMYYSGEYYGKSQPARFSDVTPNDSTDLANAGSVFVGVAGDIKVDGLISGTVTFKSVSGWLSGLYKRVYATGTTATNIIVGY